MGVVKYWSPSLLDGSVTTAKLADNAVTTPKLAIAAVDTSQLALQSVDWPRIKLGNVRQDRMDTTAVSSSGNISASTTASLVLLPYCFWPMIHVQATTFVRMTGHITDAPGADNPRFGLRNDDSVSRTYDMDYRYIAA